MWRNPSHGHGPAALATWPPLGLRPVGYPNQWRAVPLLSWGAWTIGGRFHYFLGGAGPLLSLGILNQWRAVPLTYGGSCTIGSPTFMGGFWQHTFSSRPFVIFPHQYSVWSSPAFLDTNLCPAYRRYPPEFLPFKPVKGLVSSEKKLSCFTGA